MAHMTKRKPKNNSSNSLIEAIENWSLPFRDTKHGYSIHVLGRARSNESRVEHIVKNRHNLKVKDLNLVPIGINNYYEYKKDPIYKNTYNYYLMRKGADKGFIKISVQVDHKDHTKAWIKTIYITHKIK